MDRNGASSRIPNLAHPADHRHHDHCRMRLGRPIARDVPRVTVTLRPRLGVRSPAQCRAGRWPWCKPGGMKAGAQPSPQSCPGPSRRQPYDWRDLAGVALRRSADEDVDGPGGYLGLTLPKECDAARRALEDGDRNKMSSTSLTGDVAGGIDEGRQLIEQAAHTTIPVLQPPELPQAGPSQLHGRDRLAAGAPGALSTCEPVQDPGLLERGMAKMSPETRGGEAGGS